MDYADIKSRAAQATAAAAAQGTQPQLVRNALYTWDASKRFSFPFLGEHVPEGWTRTGDLWFIDMTGRGEAGGAAMTQYEVMKRLQKYKRDKNMGVGLTERSEQFGYLAFYRKE